MKNDIALVFPVFNALEYTKRCLKDIYSRFNKKSDEDLPISIIIADDNSSDGSYDWIKTNYPKVHLLKGDGNLWWSGGVNICIEYALKTLKCDYILLWNNDIEPNDLYFGNLFEIVSKNNPDNIIASRIYLKNSDNIILSLGGTFSPKTGEYSLKGWGKTDNGQFNTVNEADWFSGMGTTIHKKIFEKIGYFDDKKFPQYHGDSDFGLRAGKAGYKIFVYPELKIWNDRTNTGYSNNGSFSTFVKSLTSLKSNNNIYRDLIFYKRHTSSLLAYKQLFRKYFRHIGGYLKWTILRLVGVNKSKRTSI